MKFKNSGVMFAFEKKASKMVMCSSSFISCHSEKEENMELINGCIAKGVWEKITSSEEYKIEIWSSKHI